MMVHRAHARRPLRRLRRDASTGVVGDERLEISQLPSDPSAFQSLTVTDDAPAVAVRCYIFK